MDINNFIQIGGGLMGLCAFGQEKNPLHNNTFKSQLDCGPGYYFYEYGNKCCRNEGGVLLLWAPIIAIIFISVMVSIYLFIDCGPEKNKILAQLLKPIRSQTTINWFVVYTLFFFPRIIIRLFDYIGLPLPLKFHVQIITALPVILKIFSSFSCGDCEDKTRASLWIIIGPILWLARLIILIMMGIPGFNKLVEKSTNSVGPIENKICYIVKIINNLAAQLKQMNEDEEKDHKKDKAK